jgi:hypothetical protein
MRVTTISLDHLAAGRVSKKDRPGYAKHAAAGSIRFYLEQARRRLAREQEEVAWLEALLAERNAQVAAGTWPPQKPEES